MPLIATGAAGGAEERVSLDLLDLTGVAWLLMLMETPLPTVVAFAQAATYAGVSAMLNAVLRRRDRPGWSK